MGDGVLLLRMLEPPVRPDGVHGQAVRSVPPQLPIEARPFDAILNEVRELQGNINGNQMATGVVSASHTGTLDQVAQIENKTLRELIANQRFAIPTPTPTPTSVVGGIEE